MSTLACKWGTNWRKTNTLLSARILFLTLLWPESTKENPHGAPSPLVVPNTSDFCRLLRVGHTQENHKPKHLPRTSPVKPIERNRRMGWETGTCPPSRLLLLLGRFFHFRSRRCHGRCRGRGGRSGRGRSGRGGSGGGSGGGRRGGSLADAESGGLID